VPALSAELQAGLWRAVAITGAVPIPIMIVAMMTRLGCRFLA
jgi:hypothetical protein